MHKSYFFALKTLAAHVSASRSALHAVRYTLSSLCASVRMVCWLNGAAMVQAVSTIVRILQNYQAEAHEHEQEIRLRHKVCLVCCPQDSHEDAAENGQGMPAHKDKAI